MKKIVVSDISDQMILAKPLVGGNGKILMAQGAELKSSMVNRLKSWGVVYAGNLAGAAGLAAAFALTGLLGLRALLLHHYCGAFARLSHSLDFVRDANTATSPKTSN